MTEAMLVQVVGAAGMLINTMGWVDGLGFELLLHSITAMKANIVLVVGEDRLLTQLQTKYQVCRQHLNPVLSSCQFACLHFASSISQPFAWGTAAVGLCMHWLAFVNPCTWQEISLMCLV